MEITSHKTDMMKQYDRWLRAEIDGDAEKSEIFATHFANTSERYITGLMPDATVDSIFGGGYIYTDGKAALTPISPIVSREEIANMGSRGDFEF